MVKKIRSDDFCIGIGDRKCEEEFSVEGKVFYNGRELKNFYLYCVFVLVLVIIVMIVV